MKRGKELGLLRGEHDHAAPLATHLERYAEVGLDLQCVPDARQLIRVLVDVAIDERFAVLEHANGTAAVRHRQHVEPVLPLQSRKGLRAATDGDQRIACGVVEEGVHLLGARGARDDVANMGQRGLDVARRHLQQLLKNVEQALRKK
jgi:hypothetical protein